MLFGSLTVQGLPDMAKSQTVSGSAGGTLATLTPVSPQIGPFYGTDYGPFQGTENPNNGSFPTQDQLLADLRILKTMGNAVRVYSVTNGFDTIVRQAVNYGLAAVPSAYLGNNATANKVEMDALISLLNTTTSLSNIPFAVVGTETLLQGLPITDLVADIQYVRQNAPSGTLITTADTWSNLATYST